jgi:hypothetical protein
MLEDELLLEVVVVDLVISLMDFLVSSAVSSFFGGGMSGNFGLPVIVLVEVDPPVPVVMWVVTLIVVFSSFFSSFSSSSLAAGRRVIELLASFSADSAFSFISVMVVVILVILVVVVETILASSSSILPHSSFSVSASFWISSIDFYKALDSFSSLSFSPFALALSRVSVMTFMAAVCFLISAAILSDSFLQSLD